MTMTRPLRVAWAGALVGAVFGFLYLAYGPVPGSHTADTLLAIGIAGLGAGLGAALETTVEKRLHSRQPQAEIIPLPTDARTFEQLTARGA